MIALKTVKNELKWKVNFGFYNKKNKKGIAVWFDFMKTKAVLCYCFKDKKR